MAKPPTEVVIPSMRSLRTPQGARRFQCNLIRWTMAGLLPQSRAVELSMMAGRAVAIDQLVVDQERAKSLSLRAHRVHARAKAAFEDFEDDDPEPDVDAGIIAHILQLGPAASDREIAWARRTIEEADRAARNGQAGAGGLVVRDEEPRKQTPR